jgi:hypothetical protein
MLIIRIPDLTADIDEHDLAARSMVEMINAQRHENWVCGGGDPDDERDVRLMASGWADASGSAEAERKEDAAMLSAFIADVVAERDRLRAVVEHAINTLTGSARSAPGVLATVSLMQLALIPTTDQVDISADIGGEEGDA